MHVRLRLLASLLVIAYAPSLVRAQAPAAPGRARSGKRHRGRPFDRIQSSDDRQANVLKRRSHLLAFVLVVAASTPPGAQPNTADSVAVSQAHEKWFRGLLAEDTTTLSAVLAPDVTLGFPGGNVMPRQDFLRYLQNGQLFYDLAEHHDLRIRVYPAAAVVTGRSTLAYRFQKAAGSERLAYTATYIRAGGEWRMAAWQSTIAPAPKPPSSAMRSNGR